MQIARCKTDQRFVGIIGPVETGIGLPVRLGGVLCLPEVTEVVRAFHGVGILPRDGTNGGWVHIGSSSIV
jgi:hypothetical protein